MNESGNFALIASQVDKMLEHPIEPQYVPYPLRVSGKVVKQISTGIYRSPGNVVKELVSNAFDADAKNVYALTGKPTFDSFRAYDDGDGMSANEFKTTMQRIGASIKMPGEYTRKGRPVIGRIGIGLLAVAHISKRFRLISGKEGENTGFEAKVNMAPMFEVETEARPLEELTAGTIQLRMYSKPKEQHYTLIEVDEVDDVWRNQMRSDFMDSYFGNYNIKDYETFVKRIQQDGARISRIASYDQLLWELGLLSPVRYLDDGPIRGVRDETILDLKHRMDSYDLNLYVDGIEVRKPILFPLEEDELESGSGYGVYPLKIEMNTDLAKVKAVGYIYHQIIRIIPSELRGILPRIRNIGVGLPSENRFRVLTESPVITWQIAGELYVDEGLDTALNIDRSSFFEADASFILLREKLEATLKDEEILKAIRKRQDDRRKARRITDFASTSAMLKSLALKAGVKNPTIKRESRFDPKALELDTKSGVITVYNVGVRKAYEKMMLGVILCYQLSKSAKNPDTAFYQLLNELVVEL